MSRLAKWGPPLGVLGGFIGCWYAVSFLLLSPERRFLVPPPQAVVETGFLDHANLVELLEGLAQSARVAMLGLGIAAGLGTGLAVLMHQARWIERSLYPYAVVLQTVPILALVPLLGFWFGCRPPCRRSSRVSASPPGCRSSGRSSATSSSARASRASASSSTSTGRACNPSSSSPP